MNASTLWELLGLTGIIVFFAGLHMLWQAREEFLFWLEEYFRLLRLSVRRVAAAAPADATAESAARPRSQRKHTLRIVVGMVLAFVAAPMMLTVGLLMVWLTRRGG